MPIEPFEVEVDAATIEAVDRQLRELSYGVWLALDTEGIKAPTWCYFGLRHIMMNWE